MLSLLRLSFIVSLIASLSTDVVSGSFTGCKLVIISPLFNALNLAFTASKTPPVFGRPRFLGLVIASLMSASVLTSVLLLLLICSSLSSSTPSSFLGLASSAALTSRSAFNSATSCASISSVVSTKLLSFSLSSVKYSFGSALPISKFAARSLFHDVIFSPPVWI